MKVIESNATVVQLRNRTVEESAPHREANDLARI